MQCCKVTAFALLSLVLSLGSATSIRVAPEDVHQLGSPTPPSFPDTYEVEYDLTLPYVQSVQSRGLKYPVHAYYDGPGKRLKMDVYGGMDSTLYLPEAQYMVYPRINEQTCAVFNTSAGPTLGGVGEGSPFAAPLPDISTWQYAGSADFDGTSAYIWQLVHRDAEKVNQYYFYTDQKHGTPLRLYMMGVNLLTGSHFDEYILDITKYRPGKVLDAAFQPPDVCADVQPNPEWHHARVLATQLTSLLPSALIGADTTSHAKAAIEQLQPTQHLKEAAQFVSEFNARASMSGKPTGYKLALNRFAPMSHDQWLATMLPNSLTSPEHKKLLRQRMHEHPRFLGTYQRKLRNEELPASVDWRGTPADGVVKDQASCGSCWAFATVGAMQGAWYRATGDALGFSEQQLVDCSWEYGNNGCGGGLVAPALQYVTDIGGASQEEEYQYLGQNAYCRKNVTSNSGIFQGYQSVPAYDEQALMEAVYLHGPVAISLNAAHITMKFYSEGVYYREDCATDRDHMDHAVVLVGYGTTKDGVDYWLLRNSWSKYWGEDGYFKVTRKGNDCGITSDPVMAVVEPQAAARAREMVQQRQGSKSSAMASS